MSRFNKVKRGHLGERERESEIVSEREREREREMQRSVVHEIQSAFPPPPSKSRTKGRK